MYQRNVIPIPVLTGTHPQYNCQITDLYPENNQQVTDMYQQNAHQVTDMYQQNNHQVTAMYQQNNPQVTDMYLQNNHQVTAMYQQNNHQVTDMYLQNNNQVTDMYQQNNHQVTAVYLQNNHQYLTNQPPLFIPPSNNYNHCDQTIPTLVNHHPVSMCSNSVSGLIPQYSNGHTFPAISNNFQHPSLDMYSSQNFLNDAPQTVLLLQIPLTSYKLSQPINDVFPVVYNTWNDASAHPYSVPFNSQAGFENNTNTHIVNGYDTNGHYDARKSSNRFQETLGVRDEFDLAEPPAHSGAYRYALIDAPTGPNTLKELRRTSNRAYGLAIFQDDTMDEFIVVAETLNGQVRVFNSLGQPCYMVTSELQYPRLVALYRHGCVVVDNTVMFSSLRYRIPPTLNTVDSSMNEIGWGLHLFIKDGPFCVNHFRPQMTNMGCVRCINMDHKGRLIVVQRYQITIFWERLSMDVYSNFHPRDSLSHPSAVCADDQERLYITEFKEHNIKVFSYRGQYIQTFGGPAVLNFPIAIAVTSGLDIIVADNDESTKVTVLDQTGRVKFQYSYPLDSRRMVINVAVSAAGLLAVTFLKANKYMLGLKRFKVATT